MDSPMEKILAMLENGKISASEAEKLLQAIENNYSDDDLEPFFYDTSISKFDNFEYIDIKKHNEFPDTSFLSFEKTGRVRIIIPEDVKLNFGERESAENSLLIKHWKDDMILARYEGEKLIIMVNPEMDKPPEIIHIELLFTTPVPVEIQSVDEDICLKHIYGDLSVKCLSSQVVIEDIHDGNTSICTTDSDICCSRSRGRVILESKTGDIEVNDAAENLLLQSISGDIEISNLEGTANIKTISGDISGSNLEGIIEIRTLSGDLKLDLVEGILTAQTKSGDIKIDEIMGKAKLENMTGDIKCDRATIEQLEIENLSGDVEVYGEVLEEGAAVAVKTRSGDIKLKLPKDADGNLTAVSTTGEVKCKTELFCETLEENRVMGKLSKTQDIELPDIVLKTISGDIRIYY